MLTRLSNLIIKSRWFVVIFWFLLVGLIMWKAPSLSKVAKTDNKSFIPASAQSSKADELMQKLYPDRAGGSSIVLTLQRKNGISSQDINYAKQLEAYLEKNKRTYKIRDIISPFSQKEFEKTMVSERKDTGLILINLTIPSSKDQTNEIVREIRGHVQDTAEQREDAPSTPKGLSMHVTGEAAIGQERMDAIHESMKLTGKVTIIMVIIILMIIYRSPVAPLVPLFTIIISFLTSRGLVAYLTLIGLKVSSLTETFLIAIIFGAGTDYCLLLISRFREEISKGKTISEALKMTIPNAGMAVVSSGSTVVIGFMFMVVAKFGLFNTTGPSIAIGAAITILAVMTFTPAALSIFGERVFWPLHPSQAVLKEKRGESFWDKLSHAVTSKSLRFIALSFIILVPFLIMAKNVTRSFDQLVGLPQHTDVVKGYEVVKSNFDQGELMPIRIVIGTSKDMWASSSLQTLDDVAYNVSKLDKVAKVRTATRPLGDKIADINVLGQVRTVSNRSSKMSYLPPTMMVKYLQLRKSMDFYIAPKGNGAILDVVLSVPPYSKEALDKVGELHKTVANTLKGSSLDGAEFYIGGVTSSFNDMRQVTADDFVNVMLFVLLGIFVVLIFLLRSIIAPIYLLLTMVMSYATTMGITYLVFQKWLGYEGLDWPVPFFAFCLLVALGIDYNIFLMSRVKEEYTPGDVSRGVARALANTGKIITSCGIIMAGTFGALMLSPLILLVELGFATVVGLLIDTFLIRSLLVPAIAVKLGEFNWWPSKRFKAAAGKA